jgi:hypothetical protein
MKMPVPETTDPAMERLADAIRLVLAAEGAPVGRTKLMRLLFLADLEATRRELPPVTRGIWRYDHFGPFDWSIIDCAEALARGSQITRTYWESDAGGSTGVDYAAPSTAAQPGQLQAAQEQIVRDIVANWRDRSLADLKEHVNELKVLTCNEPGEVFDMTTPEWREDLRFYDTLAEVEAEDDAIIRRLMAEHGD